MCRQLGRGQALSSYLCAVEHGEVVARVAVVRGVAAALRIAALLEARLPEEDRAALLHLLSRRTVMFDHNHWFACSPESADAHAHLHCWLLSCINDRCSISGLAGNSWQNPSPGAHPSQGVGGELGDLFVAKVHEQPVGEDHVKAIGRHDQLRRVRLAPATHAQTPPCCRSCKLRFTSFAIAPVRRPTR